MAKDGGGLQMLLGRLNMEKVWNGIKKMERELVHSAYFILSTCPPEAAILYLPLRADLDRK